MLELVDVLRRCLASVEFVVVATFSVAPPPTCTVMLPAATAKVPVLAPVTTLVAGVASDFLSYSLIEFDAERRCWRCSDNAAGAGEGRHDRTSRR